MARRALFPLVMCSLLSMVIVAAPARPVFADRVATTQPAAVSPAKAYLAFTLDACDRIEKNLPEFTRVAEVVAQRHINGGLIGPIYNNNHWPGQGGQYELHGRSGAMINIGFDRPFKKDRTKEEEANDVAFIGWQRGPDARDLSLMQEAKAKGQYIVGFGPRELPALAEHVKLCDAWFDTSQGNDDRVVPLGDEKVGQANSLMNCLQGWMFQAEVVSALTRKGKTPPMWKSYLYQDAHAWQDIYFLRVHFHDDFKVDPIAPGELGKAYLDQIRGFVRQFEATQLPGVSKAADLIAAEFAKGKKTLVAYKGHSLYRTVGEYEDKQWAEFHGLHHNLDGEVLLFGRTPEDSLVLRIDYTGMHIAEWCIFAVKRDRVIHVSSPNDRKEQPDLESPKHNRVVEIDMGYPFGDACVAIKGYPFKVLAPSGVMQIVSYEAINVEVMSRLMRDVKK